jgi:outer membrane protein
MRRTTRALGVLLLGRLLASAVPAAAQEQTVPQGPNSPDRPVLELSLDEAVKRAFEGNADILVEQYNPKISGEIVRQTQGYYDPLLFGTVSKASSESKSSNFFSGAPAVDVDTTLWNFGVSQEVPTGGVFNLTFNNNKQTTNNVFQTFNPAFNTTFSMALTQPLLKNFLIDPARAQIRVAKKNREVSDLQFKQTVTVVLANTKQLYYDLIFAIDNLEAARKNLALAQKLQNENEIRVKVGTMAPLDVVSAQSEVASREEGVIVAENQLYEAEDALKQVIFTRNPDTWATRIVPTDRPTAEPVPVDIEAAVRNAFENRTDVVGGRKLLERSDINVQLAKNQTLPQVDLFGSYGGSGLGGTQIIRDPPGTGPIVQIVPGGYGDAVSEAFGFDFPTWRVGVQFSYAIPNRTARAASAQARLSREQAQAAYDRLLLNAAVEVRIAGRAVETNIKRVGSTRAAHTLAAQRLDAEEKKFAAGMSTNFLVTQAQRDLALAEVNELRAVADYRKSVITFERAQEAGLGPVVSTLAAGGVTSSTFAGGNVNASSATGTGSPNP